MIQPEQAGPTVRCLRTTICGFLMPFFLAAAGGNPEAAQAAILELIDAYKPRTTAELDLVGRIVGFSIVAMDNLRLSMADDMSDTKVLRYRSNAVALSRATEQARKILQVLQEQRENTQEVPRPTIAVAPAPTKLPNQEPPCTTAATSAPVSRAPTSSQQEIETMKREARIMMGAFSKQGTGGSTAIQMNPSPALMANSAARAAITAAKRPPAA
jgi:hypothetical protein